ncbi:MAG: CBS domain-containing protein [Anaerolineaceae bacterium]|jgi:CBS domain-containing protein|nr:CBS domain-containing protein [Anaerolineae bacterium]MDO9121821.1 CBS domain-containing protein [Anaerolineaceae bacterium]MDP3451127.1 CBS domain-containing protein [Anaerolineaceae bacterium]PKO02743.1 MAG: inosine-5-monophosphate dehydrogenase [Chloroflexi bacterium HGW-Chloroflexi-5]
MKLLTVKNWMKDLVIFIDPDASVNEGLSLMRHRYLNSVIVNKTPTNPDYGIVTSIDICDKIVAQKNNPAETKIREIMVSPVVTVPTTMKLTECAALMKQLRVHHLPVVDEDGLIVGMISATDFLVVAEAMGTNFEERSLH